MALNIFARHRVFIFLVSLCALPALEQSAAAQKKKATPVRCVAVHGSLLAQVKSGGWETVPAQSNVATDRLLVALFGADFRAASGAVEVRLIADVGQRGPFPVLEAAARFHAAAGVDLDLTLERGIVVLTHKKKTAAKVRLRVRDDTFDLTLEPKARVGIEVYGRHLPGMPQLNDPKQDQPVATTVLFALEGEVVVGTAKEKTRLHAPPGPALFLWDNVSNMSEVQRFESLPDSVKPMDAKERQAFDAICVHSKGWFADPGNHGNTLEKAVASADAAERRAAVVALGAVDELARLVNVLGNKEHPEARAMAVLVLRHWLGREAGQSIRLFDHLTKAEKYTAIQAKNLLYLLHGIEEDRRRHPQTYDLLIQALNASKTPTRELARWHLVRLVPHGKSIAYDAAGPEAQRLEAIAAWRKIVPEGELPRPPQKKP